MEKSLGPAMDREAMLYERNALLEERQSKVMEEFDRVMQQSSAAPLDYALSPAKEPSPPGETKSLAESGKGDRMRPEQVLNALVQFNDKCRALEVQVKETTAQLDKKLEYQRSLDQECLHLERERSASQGRVKSTRLKLDKLERQVDEQERKLQDREMQNANLKKQRSELQRELERLAPTPRSNASQIQYLSHDKETLKSLLQEAKQRRPLLQKQLLWEKEERRNQGIRLEKQVAHLLKVFQKQNHLIVNLRKQKQLHMASGSRGRGSRDHAVSVSSSNPIDSTKKNLATAVNGSNPNQKRCAAADNHSNLLQNINEVQTSVSILPHDNHDAETSRSNLFQTGTASKISNILLQDNHDAETSSSNLSQNDTAADTVNSINLPQNNRDAETSSSSLSQNDTLTEVSNILSQDNHDAETSCSNLSQNDTAAERTNNILPHDYHDAETSSSNLSENDIAAERTNNILPHDYHDAETSSSNLSENDTAAGITSNSILPHT